MLILQDYESAEKLFEQAAQWLLRLLHDQGGKETQPFEISIRQIDTLAKIIFCEKVDRYIKHRIETDKVLIGILKDIQNNMSEIAINSRRGS